MIKRFRVQNYKALRDVTVDLTPIHVLIGPNDSGKTSILEAIAALCRSADHDLPQAFTGLWDGPDLVWRNEPDLPVALEAAVTNQQTVEYHLSCRFPATGRRALVHKEEILQANKPLDLTQQGHASSRVLRIADRSEAAPDEKRDAARLIHDALAGVHFYRWDPRMLALPVAPDSTRRFRMEASGFGLALCLDDILGDDRKRFTSLDSHRPPWT